MKTKQKKEKESEEFLSTEWGIMKSNANSTLSIELPKVGGALKGIDEKCSVNAVNGTAGFSISLPFSPARGDSPELNLSNNSGAGNGFFGLGWSLSFIKRKTDKKLLEYLEVIDSDIVLFSKAEELTPELVKYSDGNLRKDMKGNYLFKDIPSSDDQYLNQYYKPRSKGLLDWIEQWQIKISYIINKPSEDLKSASSEATKGGPPTSKLVVSSVPENSQPIVKIAINPTPTHP